MSRKEFSLILLVVLLVCGPRSISQAGESKIYWTDAGTDKIQYANLDGSNVQDLIARPTRLGDPHGVAVDVANGKIYWTEEWSDEIGYANLDGSNIQDLIYTRGVLAPKSIALDVEGGKMYWIQTFLFSSEIWRANLNGSNPQRIYGRTLLDSLRGIALDTAEGKVYWTQKGILASGRILRANLNGSNVKTVVTGLGIPSGIALDTTGGKMYWTDSDRIWCANLSGSNVQTLVTRGLDEPFDIDLDIADGKMYWVEQRGGKIRRSNLDGSNVQTLVSGLSRPFGIALGKSDAEPKKIAEDVNGDGVVNIQDLVLVAVNFVRTGKNIADVNGDGVVNIVDLTLVAGAFGTTAGAPSMWKLDQDITPTRTQVEQWLRQAREMNLTGPAFQRGVLMLEQLLAALTPKETALLPNYPNPFNPETWIPYQLATPSDVSISIYAVDGRLVRKLDIGHQPVDVYEYRSRAAYWDGRNALGEPVASGVYFYTLTAGEFTATRRMLIVK